MARGGKFDDPTDPPGAAARPMGEAASWEADDHETLRLLAEEVSVGKEQRETGRVRIQVVTHRREEDVELPLSKETVEVERVAINRPIERIPAVREEGDVTIMPVVEEVVTITRQLVLKEELHVRRVRSTEVHRERVVLRRQEAVVTRIPAEASGQKPKGS